MLIQSGGTLTGTGILTVNGTSTFSGTIAESGAGGETIAAGGANFGPGATTLTLTGRTLALGGSNTVNGNSQVIDLNASGALTIESGATLTDLTNTAGSGPLLIKTPVGDRWDCRRWGHMDEKRQRHFGRQRRLQQ